MNNSLILFCLIFQSQFWRPPMLTICLNNLKKPRPILRTNAAKILGMFPRVAPPPLPPPQGAVIILGKPPTFSRLCKTILPLRWQAVKAIRPTVDADVYQESVRPQYIGIEYVLKSIFLKKNYPRMV